MENINGVGKKERDALDRLMSNIHGPTRFGESVFERKQRAEKAAKEAAELWVV